MKNATSRTAVPKHRGRVRLQCCFSSTETVQTIEMENPGRPPRLSHSTWALKGFRASSVLLSNSRHWFTTSFLQEEGAGMRCSECVCCFTSRETVQTIETGSPGRPPRLSHSSWVLKSLRSSPVLLYVHRDPYGLLLILLGTFEEPWTATSPLCIQLFLSSAGPLFSSSVLPSNSFGRCRKAMLGACAALRPQRPYRLYRRVAQDGHLDFHTAPEPLRLSYSSFWALQGLRFEVQCCLQTLSDGAGKLCWECVLLYVHRDPTDYY